MEQLLKLEGFNKNYKIEKILGFGAMGTVYLATDKRLERLVAIKALNLESLDNYMGEDIDVVIERFKREAIAVAKLSHPNIVSIYDVGFEKDFHYMVIEYLEGTDLSVLKNKKNHLTIKQIVNIGIQICNALEFAHKRGIIHRDIKPANIVYTVDNIAKLMDFGVAMLNKESQMRISQEGSIFGSIMYISSEQLSNSLNADARSDIYSLGATLYELLAGRPAFDGDNVASLVMNILKMEPVPPGKFNYEIPEALDEIILKALSKNVKNRYQTAEEMGKDLFNFLHNKSANIDKANQDHKTEEELIQEKEKLEKEKAIIKEQAELVNKIRGEFLENLSHEIRTPLTGVIGFVDLLLKTKLDDTQQFYLTAVHQSANSLLDIITDKFNFSKIETGKLELDIEITDLLEFCSQVVDMLNCQVHKADLEILLNLSNDIPRFIWIDAIMLKQVLSNLLSNAVKFTSQGEVELKVEVLAKEADGETTFRFSVRDTGLGIEAKKQQIIFESFSREDSITNRRLGLTIANKLLTNMDSRLQLESTFGKGSTFYFDIKLEALYDELLEWENTNKIKNILIVDDNAHTRKILKDMLLFKQINSDEAKNGIDALEKIADSNKYDIVLMDYQMPYMDGIKTIRNIREKLNLSEQQLPVILLYGSTDDEFVFNACRELKIQQRLVKPVKIRQLFDSLSNLNKNEHNINDFPTEKNNRYDKEQNTKPAGTSKPATILITEDHHVNMLLAKAIIKEILPESRIIEAINGKEAIDQFIKEKPDIIFMDVQMPELNGYEAATEIRMLEKEGRVPIIALTAATIKGERKKCLEAGMDDYLTKPVIKDTIEKAIHKWFV
jgi:serine/threonine protein kinase/CheY-like chemotaxis protein